MVKGSGEREWGGILTAVGEAVVDGEAAEMGQGPAAPSAIGGNGRRLGSTIEDWR